MLGGLMTGITLSVDVDNGFFDRMIVAPVPRSALVIGRVLGAAAIALFQACLYLALGVIFGAPIEGGVLGVLLILMLAGALRSVDGRARRRTFAARTGPVGAGDVPARLRDHLSFLGVLPARSC